MEVLLVALPKQDRLVSIKYVSLFLIVYFSFQNIYIDVKKKSFYVILVSRQFLGFCDLDNRKMLFSTIFQGGGLSPHVALPRGCSRP